MLQSFDNDIINCLSTLEKGDTILYPTDTIWGLGCDASNEAAVEKINELKNRPPNKSFIVLMADVQMLRNYLANPLPDLEDFMNSFAEPTTVIFDHIIGIASNVLAADGSLGIRIPKDDFCIALLKRFRKPIVSTSANISGFPPPKVFSDIDMAVKQGVDYVVNYRQDDSTPVEPSAVVKCNKDGRFTILRP